MIGVDAVLENRVLFGSVNAHRDDWVAGVEALDRAREQFPGALEELDRPPRPARPVRGRVRLPAAGRRRSSSTVGAREQQVEIERRRAARAGHLAEVGQREPGGEERPQLILDRSALVVHGVLAEGYDLGSRS